MSHKKETGTGIAERTSIFSHKMRDKIYDEFMIYILTLLNLLVLLRNTPFSRKTESFPFILICSTCILSCKISSSIITDDVHVIIPFKARITIYNKKGVPVIIGVPLSENEIKRNNIQTAILPQTFTFILTGMNFKKRLPSLSTVSISRESCSSVRAKHLFHHKVSRV